MKRNNIYVNNSKFYKVEGEKKIGKITDNLTKNIKIKNIKQFNIVI